MGRALGLVSCLAAGAVCYPVYVAFFLVWPKHRALTLQVVIADVIGLALVVALRYATRRPRPRQRRDQRYMVPWNRYSFPSGHVVRAFAVCVALTMSTTACFALTLPVACLIALSRLALARHYPSDVLAGIGLGTLAGLASALPTLAHLLER
jgi:undecaprenyl-diphosphatase